MSKLSFRARALDPSKPMPIYLAEDLPDLPEYSAINRAVPQMPSGMEKEEESEHHLQRAICTGLIIPTPEVFQVDKEAYDRNYPSSYKIPRQLIHMQPLGLEQDIPDYDMDSGDEIWVNSQSRRLDITPLKFEQMMDRLEKSSGQTVVTLNEAKALLKQDDEVSIAVYDYWLNKRLKTQHPLILSVKTENRSGIAVNNPYLAFRRRTEKMQTRKNRKNDETSYEKMLKLRRDLSRAVNLLEMVKRREKTKREQLHLSIEIFEKRYQARDFSGSLLSELSSNVKSSRPAFAPLYSNQYSHHSSLTHSGLISSNSSHHYSTSQYLNSAGLVTGAVTAPTKRDLDSGSRKEKRQYKKRKHKLQREKQFQTQSSSPAAIESTVSSDEEDMNGNHFAGSEGEDEGLFAFRRNKNCDYHRPLTKGFGNWPWESKEENGYADPRYRFTLTSLRHPRARCIGFTRRRMGRGGRVILDRISTDTDDIWSQLDYKIFDSRVSNNPTKEENENVSRDTTYLSSSTDPILNLNEICNNNVNSNRNKKTSAPLTTRNTYNNYNNNSCIEENSINKSNSYLINKDIVKREEDCSNDDWLRQRSVTLTQEEYEELQRLGNETQNASAIVDSNKSHMKNSEYNNRSSSTNNLHNISNNNSSNSLSNSTEYVTTNTSNVRTILNSNNEKVVIKREKEDIESDFNNILDDENVDLARLSSLINASKGSTDTNDMAFGDRVAKTEFVQDEAWEVNGQLSNNNYVNNLIKDDNNSNTLRSSMQSSSRSLFSSHRTQQNGIDEKNYLNDELFRDIQKNWLHFRPKTPDMDVDPSQTNSISNQGEASVAFTEQTKIAVELQRLGASPPSSVFLSKADLDPTFVTSPFTYNDICVEEQLMGSTTDGSNSGMDLNLSGDSLNELNLSLGEEDSEKMLDNILQECQIDDIKSLNQTTNFWNGILEDGSLLDVIEDKKPTVDSKDPSVFDPEFLVNGCVTLDERDDKKSVRKISSNLHVGNSQFTIANLSTEEKFFKLEENKDHLLQTIKIEPPEEILAPTPQNPPNIPTAPVTSTISDTTKVNVLPQSINSSLSNQSACISNFNALTTPKIIIKQEQNQVPIHGNPTQQNMISLGNIKLEKGVSSGGVVASGGTFIGTDGTANVVTTHQATPIVVTQKPSQQSHIVVQQIQSPTTQIINATAQSFTVNDSGAIVLASGSANKRQINGPSDKNAIQHIFKQTKLLNRKIHISQQGTMQQLKQEDDSMAGVSGTKVSTAQQQIHQTGNYIKMSTYPVVASDLSVQQQNTLSASAVAVASNHNYSLQAPTQAIAILGQNQQGSKIILNSTGTAGNAGTTSNFAIVTPIQDLQNQIHYNQIPSSNIKVNLVTSTGQQGSLVVDQKNAEVVNATTQQGITGTQPTQQRLKVEKTMNMYIDSEQRRVLYTKLVNLAAQKNNSGQTLQVTPTGTQLLNKARYVQRHAIVRPLPVTSQVVTQTGSGNVANSTIIASGSEISHKQQNSSSNDTLSATTVSGINLNTTNR